MSDENDVAAGVNWKALLSTKRLLRDEGPGYEDDDRNEFDRDYDRLVFSSDFRRLKDKTQVFPLSKNDFTRTRLTHSLEVSCVGRTLGRKLAALLKTKDLFPAADDNREVDIGTIVAAACLAHDIGNPPFGHAGERAIQAWAARNEGAEGLIRFDTPEQRADLLFFEGNAQSVRVVSRIQARRRAGGLQLTLATIGAMMKYPCGSLIDGKPRNTKNLDQKKFGFFQDESAYIVPALRELSMIEYEPNAFRRHPLSYLVEAADDICNAIVDLEDAVDQRLVSYEDAFSVLEPLARKVKTFSDKKYKNDSRVRWLRAYATNALIDECMSVFIDNKKQILSGTFSKSLVEVTEVSTYYDKAKELISRHVYDDRRVLEVEAAGFEVIGGLLDLFVPALLESETSGSKEKLRKLFPVSYLQQVGDKDEVTAVKALNKLSPYQRVLAATDYVSGMTDSFAVDLYQKLRGIRLPE